MTTTELRVCQQTATKVFIDTVTTEEESAVYLKKLTAIAISTALYLRGVFDKSAYGLRKHENLKLRILSEKSNCESATEIVSLIKGAFDAISKKYLREMVFGIFTDKDNPDDFIEAYVFKYSYHSTHQCNLTFNNKQITTLQDCDLGTETKKLLHSMLNIAHSLPPLPEECYFNIKLLYYEDITPKDYEPPGFERGRNVSTTVKGNPLVINPGSISTKFHSLSVKMKVDDFNNFNDKRQHHLSTNRVFIDEAEMNETSEPKKKKTRLIPGLNNK